VDGDGDAEPDVKEEVDKPVLVVLLKLVDVIDIDIDAEGMNECDPIAAPPWLSFNILPL
jgi:hypothetical protein